MVKEFLSQRGVSYVEHDVSLDRAAAQELVKRTGRMAVPVTIINGETIIGFDRARLEAAVSQPPGPPDLARPSFGASVADAGKITTRQGTGVTLGAYIGSVRPDSLAARLGLAKGDIITEVNKQSVTNAGELEEVLSRMDKGSYITVVFQRGDRKLTAEGAF